MVTEHHLPPVLQRKGEYSLTGVIPFGEKKNQSPFNWDNVEWHIVGFCSVSAAGEMMNKSLSCLIPAEPSLAHRQGVGMGKMDSILWDGNLPVGRIHLLESESLPLSKDFCCGMAGYSSWDGGCCFFHAFFPAGSDTSKSPSAQLPRSPHRAEAWQVHFLAQLCFCWQFHWELFHPGVNCLWLFKHSP